MKMISCESWVRRFASKISLIMGEGTRVFVIKEGFVESPNSSSGTISMMKFEFSTMMH